MTSPAVLRSARVARARPRFPAVARVTVVVPILVCLGSALFFTPWQTALPWGRSVLPSAVRTDRLLLPRLTGSFDHAPFVPAGVKEERGCRGQPTSAEPPILRRLSKRIAQQVADGEWAGLAALRMAAGFNAERLDQAITELEMAAKKVPDSAAVWSDLAALHYCRARVRDDPLELVRALAAAQQAVALAPEMPEARFNLALCQEEMGLWPFALQSWTQYQQLDPESAWALEALLHLQRLAGEAGAWEQVQPRVLAAAGRRDGAALRTLLSPHRADAWRYLEEKMLPAWGEAYLQQDRETADELLAAARVLASALLDLTGDPLYAESLAAISDADQETRRQLAEAHRAFGRGDEASLRQARTALERAGSPFASRALFKEALALHQRGEYGLAEDRLRRVEMEIAGASYHDLRAEMHWIQGLVHTERGELGAAQREYGQALQVLERLQAPDLTAGILNLIGERLLAAGDNRAAWRFLHAALRQTRDFDRPRRSREIYATAAIAAQRSGAPEVALPFQYIALREARRADDQRSLAEAYRWRALFHLELGQREKAAQDLARARETLTRIADPAARERVAAGIGAVQGALARDPRSRVEFLQASSDVYRRSEYLVNFIPTLLALGRAQLASGDREAARWSFTESIAVFEKARQDLPIQERIDFLGAMEEAHAELVAVELSAGRTGAAFEASEGRRARVLLDKWSSSGRSPAALLDSAALRRELPPDRALVEYVEVGGRLSVWVLHRDALRWIELELPVAEVSREIDRFVEEVRKPSSPNLLERRAATLYQALVAPAVQVLPAGLALVVVPEGPLWRLPFAALYDARRRQYLVEQRALSFAPSANFYIQALQRAQERHSKAPTVLVVATPSRELARRRGLQELGVVEDEGKAVAALYPRAARLFGPKATKPTFLAIAGGYETVHFSGHAIARQNVSHSSELLLSASGSDLESGALEVDEIEAADFRNTRLVVLSACGTVSGPVLAGEGVASLARPFLAAGVPGVVGTLWPMADEEAKEIFTAFHRGLAAGQPARDALRSVQIQLRGGPWRNWAALQLIGEPG